MTFQDSYVVSVKLYTPWLETVSVLPQEMISGTQEISQTSQPARPACEIIRFDLLLANYMLSLMTEITGWTSIQDTIEDQLSPEYKQSYPKHNLLVQASISAKTPTVCCNSHHHSHELHHQRVWLWGITGGSNFFSGIAEMFSAQKASPKMINLVSLIFKSDQPTVLVTKGESDVGELACDVILIKKGVKSSPP